MTDTTLMLAIDTSTEQTGIGLYDGSCLDDVSWSSCREHTVVLLDEIDHQLKRSNVTVAHIGAVAVAIGPGRFNALRVGMSIAKGLAMSLEIPIVGVSTPEAIAHPWRNHQVPVVSVIQAGRTRVVWQVFGIDSGHDRAVARNTSVDEFVTSIAGLASDIVVTGEIDQVLTQQLALLPNAVVPPIAARLGRAGAVAELAWKRWQEGDVDDLVLLQPVYLHGQRVAETVANVS